jgi:hypothetical protein
MRAELHVFRKRFHEPDRGNAIVIFTVFLVALCGFAALSLDVGNVFREQRKAHIGTDAAALAGVANLSGGMTNLSQEKLDAVAEARVIANTNGVTDAEIAAGARKRLPGEIQVGQWSGGVFIPDAAPYTAVRVPARRSVPLNFGKVVGLGVINPAVDSVAVLGAISIPYGVPTNVLVGVGETLELQPWPRTAGEGGVGGNWGPLDMCGTLSGKNATIRAINGGGCFSTPGDFSSVATGIDGLIEAFEQFYRNPGNPQHLAVLPLTSMYPDGNHQVEIKGYVVVQLQEDGHKTGGNWRLNVTVLGYGYSALRQYGFAPARVLVE